MVTHAHGRSDITIIVEVAAILTGVITLIAYLGNRKHNKLQLEIAELDKEIKTLQLSKEKVV